MFTIRKLLKLLLKSKKVDGVRPSENMKDNLLFDAESIAPVEKEEQGDNTVASEVIPTEGPIKIVDIRSPKITNEAPPFSQDYFLEGAEQNTHATFEVTVEVSERTIEKHKINVSLPEPQTADQRLECKVYHIRKSGPQKELNRTIKRVAKEMAFSINHAFAGTTSEKEIVKSFREFVGAQPSLRKLRYYRAVAKLLYMQEFDPACLTEANDEVEM